MPDFILNKKITLANNYKIYCQVTDAPGSDLYVALIAGGPGLGLAGIDEYVPELKKQYGTNPPCHFILFDPLSCGKSDKAMAPDTEYSIAGQAEIATQVIEAVQKELKITKMNLRIIGRSAGAMVALQIPPLRPEWITDENHPIHLSQIIPVSMPANYQTVEKSIAFVKEHYNHRHDLPHIIESLEREAQGGIRTDDDHRDFINNFLITYSVLWSDAAERSSAGFAFKLAKYMLANSYALTLFFINLASHFSPGIKRVSELFQNSSVESLNSFYKNKFYGFDINELMEQYKTIYERLNIFFISGNRDHVANPKHGITDLVDKFPDNLSLMIFDAKHVMEEDHHELFFTLLHRLLTNELTEQHIQQEHSPIISCRLSPHFFPKQHLKQVPPDSFFAQNVSSNAPPVHVRERSNSL